MDSLRRLHRKIKAVDATLDDRGELSTVRGAWAEVVENVDRGAYEELLNRGFAQYAMQLAEAQTRQALCSTLTSDIINPLTSLKVKFNHYACVLPIEMRSRPLAQETQERTRKRIKEDLKESGLAYNEYAEVMLPKLKNRYSKKYSEVEVCCMQSSICYAH